MLKLFISKSKNLDEKEATVLTVLNGLYCNKHDYLFTSVIEIAHTLTGRIIDIRNKDRRMYNNIKAGIKSLAEREIITILEQDADTYIISNKGLEVDTEKDKFVVVELWELQKIFSEANKPFKVFDFFLNLVGTINNTTKEWHMSQDEMVSYWGYGKETINSYLEQLENMQLIYVYRHNKRRTDGTYHKINNSYGRYADRDSIIAEAQGYADTVECEDIWEKLDRRSIKLRYNAYCNGAKKYDDNPAAIVTLYNECVLYNKSLAFRKIEGSYDGEYKQGEPLDLSVFSDDKAKWEIVFDASTSADTDQWGEPDALEHDFSVEEMLDIPTISEVTASDLDIETDKVGINDLEDDDILPWMQDSDLQSKDTKVVLSREEAWDLFA